MPEAISNAVTWVVAKGAEFGISIMVVIVILIIGKIVISKLAGALDASLRKSGKLSDLLIGFSINIATKLMWVLVIIVCLGQLGVAVAPLIAGLGVTGFIIGFAFQETLGNLAAGFMIAINQPFKVGDVVDTGGVFGKIIEMNMMCVTLHTGDNKKITVPNGKIWGGAITNFSAL